MRDTIGRALPSLKKTLTSLIPIARSATRTTLAMVAVSLPACSPAPSTMMTMMTPMTMPPSLLAPLTSAPTTGDQTIVPSHALVSPPGKQPPSNPATLASWLSMGYGATVLGPAEPLIPLTPPGMTAPPAGANKKMLVRFVHLPDTQLADDESPNRVCDADTPGETAGAYRPQEGDQCRVLDAAVRTINELNKEMPIAFVLTGGDNADNAQKNEFQWFMQIMDGAPSVKCDSGAVDDPVAGPDNDGKDAFAAVGLAMPWWWVTGNHDVLIQGNYPVSDEYRMQAVGEDAPLGTRDYTQPGSPLTNGPVPTDPDRVPLYRAEIMKLVAADADDHGIGAAQIATGKAFYSFDVAGTSLRFIILDTCAETGSDDGMIHQADIDKILKPMFDQSVTDGKSVIIASHHASDTKADGGGLGGVLQADALTADQWTDFLGGYSNVVFSMVGHTHENLVRYITPSVGHAFWEVMTSALADYPHQFRLVEIWDDDNGWLRLTGVVTNYDTDGDPIAQQGKTLGVADAIAGWAHDGSGMATDRNVELYIPKP